jgi:hypothetical protein
VLVIIPPRNLPAFTVRQCFTLSPPETGIEADLFLIQGVEHVKADIVTKVLDGVMQKVRGPAANPAGVQKLRQICELLLGYHDPGDYRKEGHYFPCARFSLIPTEALDRLTAVCIEYGSMDLWQRAMKELHASFSHELYADFTINTIGRLLYQTQDKTHPEKADYLV